MGTLISSVVISTWVAPTPSGSFTEFNAQYENSAHD